MATLVRKNVFLDPTTLKRAQAILGRRAFRAKVMKGYDRAAGRGRGFGDVWQRR